MFQRQLHGGRRVLPFAPIVILLILALSLTQTYTAQAANFNPGCTGTTGDATALATAVSTANGNSEADTITLVGGCTYTLATTLTVNPGGGALTIEGNGSGAIISGGGAVRVFHVNSNANLILNNLTITGGVVSGTNGGGIRNASGTLTLNNSTVSGNTASGGGGIGNEGGTITLNDSAVTGNSASFGGGIHNTADGTVTLNNSTVSGNTASGNGGGGIGNEDGTVTLNNSTVSGNTATSSGGRGGGIFNADTTTLTNSTVSGNTATSSGSGGGIYNNGGTLTLTNITLSGNTASSSGGIRNASGGTATISNSIITGNTGGDCDGLLPLSGLNLGCGGSVSGSANLGALANNGGSTLTHLPGTGSAAIDAGDNAICAAAPVGNDDQIGADRRPFDGDGNGTATCDLGAVEVQQFTPPTVSIAPASVSVGEGTNTGITLTRSYSTASALAVSLNITVSGATTADYSITGGSISGQSGSVTATIPAGQASVDLSFAAADDVHAEADESVTLTLVDGAAYDLGATTASTLTIPANDLVVINGNDSGEGSLRQAVTNANAFASNDTITFSGVTSVNLTSGELTLVNNGTLTIEGGSGVTVTRSSVSLFRIFQLTSGANVTLNNLTITGGNMGDGGGIVNNGGTLTLNNSTVSGNLSAFGGGISNNDGGTLTLNNSIVSGNSASSGGGIINWIGTVTLNNSTISGNSAGSGGGGGIYNYAILILNNSNITNNSSSDDGGGMWNQGTLTITNSTISGNSAASDGGGIDDDGGPSITITNSVFSGNSTGSGDGGGIDNQSTLTITNSTFANNSAGDDGGAIWNGGTVTITNSIVSENLAGSGGGIFNLGITVTVTNSTVSGNSASTSGGGIWNGGSTTTLNNSIVANSTAGGDCEIDSGTINGSHSLVEDGSCVNGTNINNLTGDPALNGDLTLSASSPAVNAGDNSLIPGGITTDLAGNARIQGGTVDMGAYESAFLPPDLSINDVTLLEGTGGTTTFSFTVSLSAAAVGGGVTFDITTADNTATTINNDYVANTLTGQSIAQGNTSYSFDVTVNGDAVAELDETFFVNVSNVIGAAVSDAQGQGTITNDDSTGILVSPTSGLTTTEAGGTTTFEVVLNSEPTADVLIALTSSNTNEGTVDPASLTFTDGNWDTPQTVTVTGVDDAFADGDMVFHISFVVTSGDTDYDGTVLPDVPVTNTDDDQAGVTITPTQLLGRENETHSYTIQFSSIPSGTVTVQAAFDPAYLELNGSSTSPLTLTFSDAAPQTVYVRVVQNDNDDANRTTVISHTISASAAAEYTAGTALANVTVNIEDYPPPPPVPLCEDHNFDEGGIVRSSTIDGIDYAINCRVMYQNGHPTTWFGADLYHPGHIGIQGVLDLGVIQAIDIFSPSGMTYFEGGAVFCLRGSGTLIWMAAVNQPRIAEIIGSYSVPDFPGFTCATLFEPGTLVLVSRNPIS